MSSLISIITPMYKGAALVPETIKSVLRQTINDWEMIVVDDCSPDNGEGMAIVREFAKIDGRIKPIQLAENRGSSGARNEAMRNAKGRFFAFLDSDDLWDSNYLEVMMHRINTNVNEKAAIYFSGYRRMNSNCTAEILPPYFSKGIKTFDRLLYHCPIFPSAAIFDTAKLSKPLFFREDMRNLRDDWVFWIDITRQGFVAVGYTDILVSYRMRSDSLTAYKTKLIKPQFNMFHKVLGMNIFKSILYLFLWAINGINKYWRLKM